MGRPWVPIEPYLDKLEQALLLGASFKHAAQYAGVSESTFIRWRQRMDGASDTSALGQLRRRLQEVEAKVALRWLAKIEAASAEDWKAASWLLSHRFPETYGTPGVQKLAFTDADGQHNAIPQLTIVLSQEPTPSAEEWQQRLQASRNGHAPVEEP